MKRILAYIIICITAIAGVRAQSAEEAFPDTTVFFVNIYPGHDIYELEGHSAILVLINGKSLKAYNFGTFDFDAPNFVYRFVKGETDYKATVSPGDFFLAHYKAAGRRIEGHMLNLDGAEKARLIAALDENVKPQNAVYRYNYVKDNCATRPLAAVEAAVGDTVHLAPAPAEAQSAWPVSYRLIMRHYHRNYPWYQFGIDLALGSGIDYPLTRREMAFAPAELDRMMPGATIAGKPLVSESFDINDVAPDAAIEGPTPWYLTPNAVCWAFFVLCTVLTVRDIKRRRVCRIFDTVFFTLLGLTGCLLTFLIFVSVHEATSPNYLYAWLNPLCLIPPIFIWIKRTGRFLICYQMCNFAVLLALCIAWPFLPQSANAAFVPLIGADMMRSASLIYINLKLNKPSLNVKH